MDNGREFCNHMFFGKALDAKTFFTHPHSPWEKGLIENTNGLIRQYFPKGTDFNQVSDEELLFVQNELNNRPRKRSFGEAKIIRLANTTRSLYSTN